MLDLSVEDCQSKSMKGNGRKKKPKGKVIPEKRSVAKPAKRPPMVPCLPLGNA